MSSTDPQDQSLPNATPGVPGQPDEEPLVHAEDDEVAPLPDDEVEGVLEGEVAAEDTEAIHAEVDADPGEAEPEGESAEEAFTHMAEPAPRPRAPKPPPKKGISLKETSVPILATVGLLLMGFAVYGVMLVTGIKQDARESARAVGFLMIFTGGPIGLILFACAGLFLTQVMKEKAKAKALASPDALPQAGKVKR